MIRMTSLLALYIFLKIGGFMENPLKVSLENIIPLTEARDHFSQIVNEVQKDKLYVLTKGGKPAVAIVDVKYLEHITGGEAKVEQVREEIKKAPEKVGLPPMIQHNTTPTPPPATPKPPSPPTSTPQQPKPVSFPQNNQPKPAPAGFAAPQPTPPAPTPTPAPPKPEPLKTPPVNPATPPPVGEKIDIQFSQEPPAEDKNIAKNHFAAPDDKTPPSQYAGASQEEPEDMSID